MWIYGNSYILLSGLQIGTVLWKIIYLKLTIFIFHDPEIPLWPMYNRKRLNKVLGIIIFNSRSLKLSYVFSVERYIAVRTNEVTCSNM